MLIESEDYLQDVTFDYYSNKMAVCSSDRRIQIYKRRTENQKMLVPENDELDKEDDKEGCNDFSNWELESSWEAHDAPVMRVIFSSPEYGSLLASSGFDKRVIIWQEKLEGGKSFWITKQKIQEFSDNVEDISFCPKIYGLKLAVCTYNGKIKIFEPKDYVFYVNWNCIVQKDINLACSSICWNPSPLDPQSFVLGCYNTSAVPGNPLPSNELKENGLIQVYAYCDVKKDFICLASLCTNEHTNSITFVEWAPQFGRSYHMISSCSLDQKIIIWKFELNYDLNQEQFHNVKIEPSSLSKMLMVETLNPVHRVSFNVSGTILSSNDSAGLIKIFKKEDGEFKEIFEFKSKIKACNSDFVNID